MFKEYISESGSLNRDNFNFVTNEIVKMLSEKNLSIADTKGIFCRVIERLETVMPVTIDSVEDRLRIKDCGKYLEIGVYADHLNIGSRKKISLFFYDEKGKKYTPRSITTDITMYGENGEKVTFDDLLNVSVDPEYLEFSTSNSNAKNMIVNINVRDTDNDSVSGEIQFTIEEII